MQRAFNYFANAANAGNANALAFLGKVGLPPLVRSGTVDLAKRVELKNRTPIRTRRASGSLCVVSLVGTTGVSGIIDRAP